MKSINEVLEASPTNYRNSPHTFALVGDQIEKRFGLKARKEYDARTNCRTFASWSHLGYRVKAKERALQSITYVEKKDEAGNIIEKYPRKISLFYISQVAPVEKSRV
ncbi:MAG: hypothetical protein Q7R79_03185 [bacterium]|nr:hypothetical protein [bacterium]